GRDGGTALGLDGTGSKCHMSDGVAGGVSGAANDYVLYRGPADDKAPPRLETDAASLTGTPEAISWGVFPLGQNDAFYLRWNGGGGVRSEEHTSELQSRENLVCRLLLE